MNRRGFLLSCAAAVVAPALPIDGLGKDVAENATKWISISDHLLDPDAPLTSELDGRIKPVDFGLA